MKPSKKIISIPFPQVFQSLRMLFAKFAMASYSFSPIR